MAISREKLDTVLEAWRQEYGYPNDDERGEMDPASVGVSGRRVPIGTLADEFNAAWVKLAGGNTIEYRMAMALKGDAFANSANIELILDRLWTWGVSMAEREYRDHVEWAKRYFCAVLTITRAA